MERRDYLEQVAEQIRCKRAVPAVTAELERHILDQKEAFMEAGLSEAEAEAAAVLEMGNPVEAGQELDQIHRPVMPWRSILLIGMTALGGQLLLSLLAAQTDTIPFSRNLFFLIIGYAVMISICYVDYTWIAKHAAKFMTGIAVLTACTSVFGLSVNGQRCWLYLPFLNLALDIRILSWLFVPLYCAMLYHVKTSEKRKTFRVLLWLFLPTVFTTLGFGTFQGTLLFFLLLLCTSVAIYKDWFPVKHKRRILALCWITAVAVPLLLAGCILLFGAEYQAARLTAMFSAHPDMNYTTNVLRELFTASHFIGSSETGSVFADKLPGADSYLLSFVNCRYGILAGAAVCGILLTLFIGLLVRSLRQRNQLGMLMSSGCSMIFLLQLILWIGQNLGMQPIFSIYCPFVMYGGSGALVTFILLGITLCVHRNERVLPSEVLL